MRLQLLAALVGVLTLAPAAGAADWSRVAPPVKEPMYQTKAPRYGLLAFGPEAKFRVWVVIDGDTVYVDRNGNGDLTEPGEKLTWSKPRQSSQPYYSQESWIQAITLNDGKRKHEVSLTRYRVRADFAPKSPWEQQLKELAGQDPTAEVIDIHASVELHGLPGGKIAFSGRISQYAGTDAAGSLHFAARPQDAPVVHFGGPWQMSLQVKQSLAAGDKADDLMTMVGTPGRGPGSFASVGFSGLIGDEVYPVAHLELPGGIKLREVLKHRC
jgi:hypothetical protein